MEQKRKQIYIGAGLAALAVVVTQLYVESETARWKPKDLVEVAVAADPIQAGAPLTAAQVKRRQIPRSYAPVTSIPVTQIEEYFGEQAAHDILPGEYLLETSFSAPEDAARSLSETLAGARAVTIPVSETSSLANSVRTGDLIDILYSVEVERTGKQMTTVLLEAVPVISTGAYQALEDGESNAGYSTVTLKLSPEDALRLKHAEKTGAIDVLLRSRADTAASHPTPISDIRQVLSEADAKRYDEIAKVEPERSPNDVRDAILGQLKDYEGGKTSAR